MKRRDTGFLASDKYAGKCQEAVVGEREILSRCLPTKAG